MAPKSFYVFACVGAFVIALLIVCIGLLSAILVNQQKQPKAPPTTEITTPNVPTKFKNVVVLVDASSGVNTTILDNEASFLSKDLRNSLLKRSKDYSVKIAASAFASKLSSQLNYVDLSDADAVNNLTDAIRKGKTEQQLDIGAALSSLNQRKQMTLLAASPLGQFTLIVMASGQGQNYNDAITEAKSLKDNGIEIITISLKDEDLKEIASPHDSFDGQPISSGNTDKMQQLADSISDIVDKQSPITVPPPTEPPSPTTPTPSTTTHRPPANTRVLILVDGSNGITQPQMIKQTAFIENELREAMMYPSEHGYRTEVLLIAYAFDTSPDNSEYIPLDIEQWIQPIMNTKLAPITTFVEPLDRLQLGQALTEVATQEVMPTHLLVLASGQGTDFQKAQTAAQNLKGKSVKIITLATVGAASELADISSDPSFVLDGRDILSGQNLASMAKNIVKCIYPQRALPPKSKPQKRISQKVVPKQKPKPIIRKAKIASPTTTTQPTNDFVILIDVSKQAVSPLIAHQTTFVENHLIPKLATTFSSSNIRVAIIPYAYFTAAVAEVFIDLNATTVRDNKEIKEQIRTAKVAPITSFMYPLDEYNLEYTLKLLIGSYFVKSTETKVILITSDKSETMQVNPTAVNLAKNITDASNKKLVVIGINGAIDAYESITNKPDMNIDGRAIKSATETDLESLANDTANALSPSTSSAVVKSKSFMMHMPHQSAVAA